MNETPSLRAVRLAKSYGKVAAIAEVSVDLEPGIWGLLGPNGSGKSTFLRLAAGELRPSLGEIRVNGEAPFANARALRAIGVCPEPDALFDELTGFEFVQSLGALSGLGKSRATARAHGAIERVGLTSEAGRRVGTYSRGMRQRIKLAQALVHDPSVLLLDEPLNGTDPVSRKLILDLVREAAARGSLVIFSTHVLHELEAVTDRILVLVRGQLVGHGRAEELRALLDTLPHRIEVTTTRARELAAAIVACAEVDSVRVPTEDHIEIATHDPERTYAALADRLCEGSYPVTSIRSPDASLEALFHLLVARGRRPVGHAARPDEEHAPKPVATSNGGSP